MQHPQASMELEGERSEEVKQWRRIKMKACCTGTGRWGSIRNYAIFSYTDRKYGLEMEKKKKTGLVRRRFDLEATVLTRPIRSLGPAQFIHLLRHGFFCHTYMIHVREI